MKRRILTLFLAVLAIGLLGSCSKINNRIDDIDKRVEGIEQEKIASIQNQIAGINQSIADLGTIRNDILNLQVAVGAKGEDISALQAADVALGKRIDELKTYVGDLSKYAEKDWATATFATLEQLGATNEALSALEELIDELGEAGEASDARIAELDEKLSKSIKSAVSRLNSSISSLEGRVEALEGMIQSVTIVPVYNDGSVEANGIILTVDFIVSPAKAVGNLTDKDIKVLINEVADVTTRAASYKSLEARIDAVVSGTGMITIKADISSVTPADGHSLVAAVKVSDGKGSDFTSEFHPVYVKPNVKTGPTEEGGVTKVTISDNSENPKVAGGILSDVFKENHSTSIEVQGIATVTFNEEATKTIKDNAGSTDVIFKVEDVTNTLANPVPDADVVIEVTMKTVGENGEEVFSEKSDKVEGSEVTIQIPMDGDIAFVKTVTLVNDAGDPIEGGVVPGSEKIENGILTFKVNHFSKYAVDYVKRQDFVSVTGVSLEPTSTSLPVGDSLRLTATIAPANATNPKVTWTSSDPTKVKVDNTGKVTAIAGGTATITVTTDDESKTATCEVTVTVEASTGYTVTFDANIYYGTAPTAQTVDENGKVTKPEDPTAYNGSIVTFAGWFKTKDETTGLLSDEWNFETDEVTADITLYAQWETTISQIVGTNENVPELADFDWDDPGLAEIPEDAWVDGSGERKAFWVPGEDGGFAMLYKEGTEDGFEVYAFGPDDNDTFYMVDYNKYVCTNDFGTFTCTMTIGYSLPGVFTSLKFVGNDLSEIYGLDFRIFNGTYAVDSASETEQYNNNNNPGWSFN